MFNSSLILAFGLDDALALIKEVVAGGSPLILAVLVVIFAIFGYRQLVANNKLEKDFRVKIEDLLREMLVRDKEAQEAIQAAVQVVHGFSSSMKEQTIACDGTKVLTEATNKAVEELRRVTEFRNNLLESLNTRIRDLEDVVRSRRVAGQ